MTVCYITGFKGTKTVLKSRSSEVKRKSEKDILETR